MRHIEEAIWSKPVVKGCLRLDCLWEAILHACNYTSLIDNAEKLHWFGVSRRSAAAWPLITSQFCNVRFGFCRCIWKERCNRSHLNKFALLSTAFNWNCMLEIYSEKKPKSSLRLKVSLSKMLNSFLLQGLLLFWKGNKVDNKLKIYQRYNNGSFGFEDWNSLGKKVFLMLSLLFQLFGASPLSYVGF